MISLISQLMSFVKVLNLAGFVEIIMIQDGKPYETVGLKFGAARMK